MDGNIADVIAMRPHQIEQQVERPLEYLKADFMADEAFGILSWRSAYENLTPDAEIIWVVSHCP